MMFTYTITIIFLITLSNAHFSGAVSCSHVLSLKESIFTEAGSQAEPQGNGSYSRVLFSYSQAHVGL